MILGISSYITSAGLNSVVSAGALGPSFSPKYFLPIYSPTWDKSVRTGANGTYTSAISISSLNLVSGTDAGLNLMGVEKIFNGVEYSISDKVFVYSLNGVGSSGNSTFVSNQNVPADVNLLNGKPVSNGISATSISAINSNTLTVTGRYNYDSSEINDYLNYNPLSAANIPLSAFYRVTSYSPKAEQQNTVGRFKCRIPASDSTFKFNGIALYLTKTDLRGFDDNGNGISFFNFSPVLFAVILFDQAQYKQALVGGINDYEISVDLGFNYDTIPSTSAGNPVYVETNYWTKMPTATTTSAYGLSYDGDVVLSSSAVADSWTPRAKLTITDNQKEQLRLSHTNDRFTDFRTINIPYNGDSSFGPLNSDRTVLSVDTCGEWDSLLQLGTDTSAYGIKSIAMGCRTSAGGYDSAATNAQDGGYTLATGVETLAKGFASVVFGLESSAIGNMNMAGGYRSKAIDVDGSNYDGDGLENDGFNFAYGKEVSAISTTTPTTPYAIREYDSIYGFNYGFGQRVLATGGAAYSFGSYTSATGLISRSVGSNNLASGPVSDSYGADNLSTDAFTTTQGYKNSATNKFAESRGHLNIASGQFGLAIGQENIAAGDFSYAIGQRNIAQSNLSYAFGYESSAIGRNSVSIGFKSLAQGTTSYAIGDQEVAIGNNSFAFGTRSSATGVESFAIGTQSISEGNKSVAIGYLTSAIGIKSFAVGTNAIANSEDSFAIGPYTNATGVRSLALGYYASTTKDDHVVIGSCKNDVGIYGKNIEIVGKKCSITDRTKITISADEVEIEGYNADSTTDSFYVWISRYSRFDTPEQSAEIDIRIIRKRFNNASKKFIVDTAFVVYNDQYNYSGVDGNKVSMILFNPSTMTFVGVKKNDRNRDPIYKVGQNDYNWLDINYPGYVILAANDYEHTLIKNNMDIGSLMNTFYTYYYNFNGCRLFNIHNYADDVADTLYLDGVLNSKQDNTVPCYVNLYANTPTRSRPARIDLISRSQWGVSDTLSCSTKPGAGRPDSLSNKQYIYTDLGYKIYKGPEGLTDDNVTTVSFFNGMNQFQ